jgi:phospholipid/cholesterol/gamma-HCH transport system ATP-binding protein
MILVNNLEYAVPNKRILHNIHLDIAEGEILAVMGMSGSGKTSLLKCLCGLRKPTGGEIWIMDENIVPMSEYDLDKVRIKIGLVFQYAALFDSLTVYENVAFGLVQHRKYRGKKLQDIVHRTLAEVDMEGTESLYPAQLSGGMQKRVGLARAMAMEPRLLFYDEPTSGLDPVIARTIDELIVHTRDRSGVTSVVVSHDIASIFRIADRIAMLEDGELIICDTPEAIRASSDPRVKEFVESA